MFKKSVMSSDGDNSQNSAGGFVMSEDHQPRETNSSCRAVNEETGDVCGETEGLRILDQFRKIYEARIKKVEEEEEEAAGEETDFIPMKLKIMKEWIKDLGEQNVMLVRTVEDLEQAACYRVKMLEEKLKETAGIVSEKMSRLTKPGEDTVNTLSKRISQLEQDEGILQQKIVFLESDIRGLLELIRRARCENCWSLQGIKFFEIKANDIPAPTDCTCTEDVGDTESIEYLKKRLEVVGENEKKARKYQAELQEKVADLDNKLASREETIKKYISMLELLRDSLKKRSARKNQTNISGSRPAGSDFESENASIMDIVESAIAEKSLEEECPEKPNRKDTKSEHDCEEIKELRAKLENKSLEIERLSRRLSCVEKESLETREALTNEVAEKHDMGMSLRAEVAALEEQCRRANMLMQFKEDIIKGMRRELKQRPNNEGPGSSRRRVRINADVVCCDQSDDGSSQVQADRNVSNLVSDLNNAKSSWKRENEALINLRSQLEEVLQELHTKEREDYERDMTNAHVKLKDIGTLLDNYKSEVIDRTETSAVKLSDSEIIINKLAKSIANLSKVCMENSNGLVLLERALERSEKEDRVSQHEARVTQAFNERWKWDVFDRQFNAMEEFRVCTVEAQAATENLKEEMEVVVCNLQTRHQRYLDLSNVVKQMHSLLTRTKENVSTVIDRIEKQEEERMFCNEKVASGEVKLKDIKNEINKARSERSRDVVDFAVEKKIPGPIDIHNPKDVVDKVVEVVEQVVSYLRLLQNQSEACWTGELRGQLSSMEQNLNELQCETERVLLDNEMAQKVFNEKILRIDKFERELDYAHTKMQDVLEAIVQSKQRMIDVGVCNLCSCTSSDSNMPASEMTSRHEEINKSDLSEIEQLKKALRSKEKLLEDKDEIIRIQKDSITMTHVELKDLHQKMQTKIDAQNIAIGQHVEEKRLLMEQSKLQNQTIGHLREAVVEAKRCLATQQQPQQKTTIDMAVSECYDKNETVRLLSLYLEETQAQYNDCLSEAAEQGTLMELQRDAIQQLQRTIIHKDLVYYTLLIKAQELFRGHVQDVRIVKSKMDNMVRTKKYLEDKYRKIKRLWQQAEQELRKIKSSSLCDGNTQQEIQCKDCSTWTDAVEFADSQEIQQKINFLLCENEDLKKQLCVRSIDFELFDQEVKNQLDDNNRDQQFARETNNKLKENENCLTTEKHQLEFVLKEHFSYLRILIAELQYAREREMLKTDSSTSALRVDIDTNTIKDELNRKHSELDKLVAEARDKEEELGMLQDMRKEFERTEGLEKINECLKKELTILRRTAESNDYCSRENIRIIRHSQNDDVDDRFFTCEECQRPKQREVEMIRQLKNQLSSTKGLTEECLEELRSSKEMLCSLRERICSLKRLLKEKSDEMVKLQADYQIMKNDYSILKTENGIFEDKAREEIREFREKLKALHSKLRLVDDNYQRVSQDFDKSQELLIQAARREVDLQHAITAMEQIFYEKLSNAEKEAKRLSDLVDTLRSELENSREEFAVREEDFTEKYRDACKQIENLEERVSVLQEAKHYLSRQLQDSRQENYSLIEENTRLTESGCRCIKEIEDTHNALLELKGECKAKSKTLDCVSAELISVATSRTEICDESHHVVSCIRAWMDEQKTLVETLSRKLKDEKKRIAQLTFEKKALVATVRELMRLNNLLSELSARRKKSGIAGHNLNRRTSKTNCCQTSPVCHYSKCCTPYRARQIDTTSSTTVYTRPLKRRCRCLTKNSKRTLPRGNSWWLPKLERVSKEFCCKTRRHVEKIHDRWQSETSMDEARDFGYQSSASK